LESSCSSRLGESCGKEQSGTGSGTRKHRGSNGALRRCGERWPADWSDGVLLPKLLSKDRDSRSGMLWDRKPFRHLYFEIWVLVIQYAVRLSVGDIFGSSAQVFLLLFVPLILQYCVFGMYRFNIGFACFTKLLHVVPEDSKRGRVVNRCMYTALGGTRSAQGVCEIG